MNWIWDLFVQNPLLGLIVLGVIGQFFTTNPKKRQQARERERQRRKQLPRQADGPRTDADDVAERIRELFQGKTSDSEALPVESEPPQAGLLQVPEPRPVRVPGLERPEHQRISRLVSQNDIDASHAYDINEEVRSIFTLDAVAAIRALVVLGPPRALASYDEDPLLSPYQRQSLHQRQV